MYVGAELPEDSESTIDPKKNQANKDKEDVVDMEEYRKWPTDQRAVERWFTVFRTNLFMAMASFPQFPAFDVTWPQLEKWYEWLMGPEIGAKSNPPSPSVLLKAERKAWQWIDRKVQMGMKLSEAMEEIKNNSLFWQREVYEHCKHLPPTKGGEPKGGGRGRSRTPWTKPWPKGKGKGKGAKNKSWQREWSRGRYKDNEEDHQGGGGKGQGKGHKGNKPESKWPKNWASHNPKNIKFCAKFLLHKNCQGPCTMSHNCPVKRSDGYICNAPPKNHTPENCPFNN